MAKRLLVLGPTGAGKTSLIRTLATEHPDHCWHLVRLNACQDESPMQPLRVHATDWAGLWHVRSRADNLATTLGELTRRIEDESPAGRTIIAFESEPDLMLRHAWSGHGQVFILPPIQDETEVFRSERESGLALREILRDTSAFGALMAAMTATTPDPADATDLLLGSLFDQSDDLSERQVQQFLSCPVGMELGARVHLQPAFAALADADMVILNTAAGDPFQSSDACWHKIAVLLNRLHRQSGRKPLTCACDLTDPKDPCRMRVLHRLGELLCKM